MNRLIPVALILLAAGCSSPPPGSPPATTPAPTQEQLALAAEGRKIMDSLPKGFRVELVSAEFRGGKPATGQAPKAHDDNSPLVVVVRCSNADDTLDTAGWNLFASAKDDFGNSVSEVVTHEALLKMAGERNETHDIPPGKTAVRTFVLHRPIPKAASVDLWVGVSFPKRPSRVPFGVTVKVPLPPRG